jgi:hypothetical protein
MKKCSLCGKEYPDDVVTCPTDANSLESVAVSPTKAPAPSATSPARPGALLLGVFVIALLAGGLIWLIWGLFQGPYSGKVGALHQGMSRENVIEALGQPYGTSGDGLSYRNDGADTVLEIQFDNSGTISAWAIVEAPKQGDSGFHYYKVISSHSFSGSSP